MKVEFFLKIFYHTSPTSCIIKKTSKVLIILKVDFYFNFYNIQ